MKKSTACLSSFQKILTKRCAVHSLLFCTLHFNQKKCIKSAMESKMTERKVKDEVIREKMQGGMGKITKKTTTGVKEKVRRRRTEGGKVK